MSYRNSKIASVIGATIASASSSLYGFRFLGKCKAEASDNSDGLPSSNSGVKLLFLGTGSSTGCPKPLCSILFPQNIPHSSKNRKLEGFQNEMKNRCHTSILASRGDPRLNKNYRNNPSLLISHSNNDDIYDSVDGKNTSHVDEDIRNVIIDVGKTFRETALRWMPLHGIHSIDGVVITHEHADAMLGLDDLRGFQMTKQIATNYGTVSTAIDPLQIYLSEKCFNRVKEQFGYLVPKDKGDTDEDKNEKVIRHIASLQFNTVFYFEPFVVAGLKMIPLPVIHGEDFICNGYAFSVKSKSDTGDKVTHVVYLSDLSRMPEETLKFILEELPPTDILVVDSLSFHKPHNVHFSLDQAMDLVKKIRSKKTYIVGIDCDDFPEHYDANVWIKARDPSVELAHDGLAIQL